MARQLIINFHGVGSCPRAFEAGEQGVWVEEGLLRPMLGAMAGRGDIEVTVDDGNASDHAIVLPLLKSLGMKAHFFVLLNKLDKPGYLTRAQVRELSDSGMDLGTHGKDHVDWRRLDDGALQAEVVDAKGDLEDLLGAEVTEAACPFGSYDRRVLKSLRQAGYRRIYTSDGGYADTRNWLLPRNTIRSTDSLATLENLMATGWPVSQRLAMRVKRNLKRWR